MKKSFGILAIFIFMCDLVFAQENLFEKVKTGFTASKAANEKIERFKSRKAIKQWEQILLRLNITLSKNFKGTFNIFGKNLEFEITEDYGKDVNGVQGYKAELKDGGYAILSRSENGIGASIWYKESFYSIEAIEEGIYFVSEVDINEIAKHENPNDYGSVKKLNKTTQNTSVTSVLSPATVKVFVAYTPAVAQNYNVSNLISECRNVTNNAYTNSLISSNIEIAGSAQLTYTESGSGSTDVDRFKTKNDCYLDDIHSLRNQYEADVCVLLVNTLDNNGWSASIGAQFDDAFCVVKASSATSYYSFPHELGHFFGCRHEEDNSSNEPYANAHGFYWNGKLPYSHNHNYPYKTIMCVDEKYYRVQYFSNPYVYDQDNNPIGSTNYYYSAYAIDDYASYIAGFEPHYTTSGIMDINEWWSGTITITDDLIIASGVTLTIQSGSTIQIASGKTLTVIGTLTAQGTSGNNITFTRSGTVGTWGGIQFNNGSSGNLQYCNIQYANNGIYCYNSSPTIKYSTIDNNGTAVYCDYYSSPVMVGNNIRYNTSYGIRCNSFSSPNLTDNGYPGSNVIRNNYTGINTTYFCNPNMSGYMSYGNSIFDNTGDEVSALYNCSISAQKVYWGSSPTYYAYQSTIDYSNPLTTNPNPGRMIIAYDNNMNSIPISISYSVQADDLSSALDKQRDKKYDEAIALFLEVFKSNKDALVGKFALIKIEECFTQAGKKDFLEYSKKELKPIIKTADETFVVLLELETHQLVNAGLYTEAMDNLFLIKNKYNLNKEIDKNTIYRIGVFYAQLYGDKQNAKKYFDELKMKYPGDELVNDIDRWMNTANGVNSNGKYLPVAQAALEIPAVESFGVSVENYPNPFNPSTTISYALLEEGKISIKIFDALGREIKTLVNETVSKGEHSVVWDGTDYASGIYFYRIEFKGKAIYKKMMLLK